MKRNKKKRSNGNAINITAYGIDMAAFGTADKTVLVRADRLGTAIYLTVYDNNPLQKKPDSSGLLEGSKKEAGEFFGHFKKSGNKLFVDVPIDLQELPHISDAMYDWQTFKRPVDRAYGGQAPLSRDIGTHVARFSLLFRQNFLNVDGSSLGKTIFETYPRANLERIGLKYESYKSNKTKKYVSKIQSSNGLLWGVPSENENPHSRNLLYNVKKMRLKAVGKLTLGDDQFDAIICAITGVLIPTQPISENELDLVLHEKRFKASTPYKVAEGYVLISQKHVAEKKQIHSQFFRGITQIYVRTEDSWSHDYFLEGIRGSINRFVF